MVVFYHPAFLIMALGAYPAVMLAQARAARVKEMPFRQGLPLEQVKLAL